ncbi:MAG: GTPase Era [Coriobacteriia bacterium]|nr:GTPase Era [Coriobacteriia bacterium]
MTFDPASFDPEDFDPSTLGDQGVDLFHADEGFRSGFVTLLGRPSVGKSTLLNAIMGKKLAIMSETPQTTRHRFRAIHTTDGFQLVIVDTPGIHKPHDALGSELNTTALKSLDGIDVAAFLLDASAPFGRGDEWVIDELAKARRCKKILVISKSDLVDAGTLAKQRALAAEKLDWDAVVELSSVTGDGVETFVNQVAELLPEGPLWFPADMETDQPEEMIVAEFIREKILNSMRDEVPHAVGVVVDEYEYNCKKDLQRIYASIYVERKSQKGIIIGKGGAAIKKVGTEARQDLETLLGCRVFLELQVKIRKNWRRDLNQIRRFGYGEGEY